MLKKTLIVITIFLAWITDTHAITISSKIKSIYNNFVFKIEDKYDLEKQNTFLSSLNTKLIKYKDSSKYKNNTAIQSALEQFLYLNDKKISDIRREIILAKFKDVNNYDISYEEEISKNKAIIDKHSYSSYFNNISYTNNHIFLEDWVWYTYSFKQYSFFPENANITKKDLEHNNINLDTDLLFITDKWSLWFVKNPNKVKIISDDIIKNVENKYYFLEEIKDDKINIQDRDYDNDFIMINELSEGLTLWLDSKDDKIESIYNYIISNTEYTQVIDLNDAKIFSWIETFNNNAWVCEWYVKLMTYMLLFSWINDSEVIRWYVIDAQDFPKIWHAWMKINWKYYDPTFDDPIWAISDRSIGEYKYFNLPKDLFYSNRFEQGNLPEDIKNMTSYEIKNYINIKLYSLHEKYEDEKYELLKLIKLKVDNNIAYDEKIDINNLWNILPKYLVDNFKFIEDWSTRHISKLNYYELNNENVESLLEQLDYNLDWHYFFKWVDDNWNISYKLAYNVEI